MVFLRCFSIDMPATKISELTFILRLTVKRFYDKFRERIKDIFDNELPPNHNVELDETYFGTERTK